MDAWESWGLHVLLVSGSFLRAPKIKKQLLEDNCTLASPSLSGIEADPNGNYTF